MRRGFTLVELMVVIGIMAVLMMISVPLFQRFSRGQSLAGACRVFQKTFGLARWEALRKRERVRIVFTKTALWTYRDSDGYGDGQPIPLPRGITFVYNFGDPPGLSAPDDFPLPEEITRETTGKAFPGKVEFLIDGTVNFSGGLQDVPGPKVEEIRLFDPNREITRRIPRDIRTDIVIERRGDSKVGYVDIEPSTGRVRFKVLEAEFKEAGE